MVTYIILVSYTEQGIRDIKESPARLEAAKDAFLAVGAQLKEFYLVTGQYDIVALVEAPDDETMAELALSLGSKGNVRTETLRAFTEEEYRKIILALP
jgi:uncharacterized protein with GYD domain